MADARFFPHDGPFTLAQLAEVGGCELAEGADPEAMFADVAPISTAGPQDVTFLDNKRYAGALEDSRAGACILAPSMTQRAREGMGLLLSDDPYRAYARIAARFHPEPEVSPGIHATAVIAADAQVCETASIGPGAVIESGAVIGARTAIGANAVIGAGVQIGEACRIGPSCVLGYCLLGDRVSLHAGVCIGNRGFGFAMGPQGHLDVPQLGRVIIEDDVEIGANSTVDRGAGPDTVIGAGSKIDNLVQIGHNVRLGRGCVLVAQVGVAGSAHLDDFVVMAGQSGVAGHLTVGKAAQIGAQSGVMRDVRPGEKVIGSPAMPAKQHFRMINMLHRMVEKKGNADE